MIIINHNTRQFNVPGADLVFGVSGDSGSEVKHFQCSRYVGNNIDLMSCFVRINFRNANGETDTYLVDDMAIDGDNVTFSWLLSPKVTEYRGQVKFVVCAVGPDLKLKWHTTQGTGQVMEGLEPDNAHIESQTADIVAQLIAMVEEQTSAVENTGADQVAAVKAAAETARTAAVTAIETAGAAVKASIPTDYAALSDAVRKVAPGIGCSAEGEVITLNDASDNPLRGLRIFGKSTQDGTPTPDNPVEIVSVGDGGSFIVKVCGRNVSDVSAPQSGYFLDGSGEQSDSSANFICFYVRAVQPNTTYTLSSNLAFYSVWEDDGKAVTKRYAGNSPQCKLTTGETAKRLRVSIHNTSGVANTAALEWFMINIGDTAAPYEPYKSHTITVSTPNGLPGIPVTSGGNYTDANGQQWICDEVDFERGVYVQRVSVGVINIATVSPVPNGLIGGIYLTLDKSYISNTDFMCSNAQTVKYSAGITEGQVYQNHANFVFVGSAKDTLESLQGRYNGGKVLYVLATPVETPLSETELAAYRALHTNKQHTTILNDSGAYMSVDYTADTKLYIDNKIKEALL